ncbi:MAG: heparinase II/III family protein [Acidobacterium ailaaui]|nr:heparinase II/III family protein [Pseudacidobacterium ailaaui]
MRIVLLFTFFTVCLYHGILHAQNEVPEYRVIPVDSLQYYLRDDVSSSLMVNGKIPTSKLAAYFRKVFSERYYYDWQYFPDRFKEYLNTYHLDDEIKANAADFMSKFPAYAYANWNLPSTYLNGEPIDAYHFRHFVRQHKMVDVALSYFILHNDPEYLSYFVRQVKSLDDALERGNYAKIKDGNGVYENFRAGTRIFNWLTVHNMFLGQPSYTDDDQLRFISTLLQHGEFLYKHNDRFEYGNHQTRGMSALAVISILLRDFKGTDLWYKKSMNILRQHILKEVNTDGFQSERSIHYHMSDIGNYFYVYQLLNRNHIAADDTFKNRLYDMFLSLCKLAFPDKSGPVLQDDTDNPWAERTYISGTMSLGYILFNDSLFGYFSDQRVDSDLYWFLSSTQLLHLKHIRQSIPDFGSVSLPQTKYYIMRQGWNSGDKVMVISAGLNEHKPDHQHGDMLGLQAVAFGHVILPNYQVRYSLPDYPFFKNSLVKNVALVDTLLQGREFVSNKGGSGFGKFNILPVPHTILWDTNSAYDVFVGTHNGFDSIGVRYYRQIIFVKNVFWIVKDNFISHAPHEYKQIWQGHYTLEKYPMNLLQSCFSDASGCNILQLNPASGVRFNGIRGKQWSVVEKEANSSFQFLTIIYPFKDYTHSISVSFPHAKNIRLNGWILNRLDFEAQGDGLKSISKNHVSFLFNARSIHFHHFYISFDTDTDVFVRELEDGSLFIQYLGFTDVSANVSGAQTIYVNGRLWHSNHITLSPGYIIKCVQ